MKTVELSLIAVATVLLFLCSRFKEIDRYYYHKGGGIGYVAKVRLYPGKELGSILLMNLTSHAKLALQDTLDREYLK